MKEGEFFKNVKQVTSPASHANSPNYQFETHQSVVYSKHTDIQPTKLDFKLGKGDLDNKFSNINMIRSQVIPDSDKSGSSSAFFNPNAGGYNSSSGFATTARYSNVHSSRVGNDPMKQSTMNYVRSIYKIIPNLAEDRLKQIAENFIRLYGTDREITTNGVKNIHRAAYESQSSSKPAQEEELKQLFSILDFNRDKRITLEDIMPLCRRYLNFEKKQIVYTPIVQERLAVARRLFKQFDVQRKGFLTEKQVPNLLNETYRCLGKTFTATEQDIKSWMKLTDSDHDGHVTLRQYEQSIIRALKKQGVKIYNQQQ